MDVAREIRKDHSPFVFLGLLQFIRWTDHCCPHCHKVFRRTYFPGSVFLGNGRRSCYGCGKVFDDESKEWPDLRNGQKFRFLLPPGVLGISGGFLLAAAIALFFASRDQTDRVFEVFILVFSLGISAIPPLVWSAIRLPAIRRSTVRYKAVASNSKRHA